MARVVIEGFRSPTEAREFAHWYEGQGEQDAGPWFEESKHRGKIDRDFIPVDCQKGIVTTGDTITFHVKP